MSLHEGTQRSGEFSGTTDPPTVGSVAECRHINGVPVRLALDTLVETGNMSLLTGYHYASLGPEPNEQPESGQALPAVPA